MDISPIISLKTEEQNFSVEFDVITAAPVGHVEKEILKGLNEVNKAIEKNDRIISELNSDIDKLTNDADGLDYTIAVASGIISGLIDSFFVGEFSLDKGTEWGKEKVDSFVTTIAKKKGYDGDSLDGAVRFLEKSYPIPADSATNLFGGGLNHHLRDFSHHPTPMGLLFSMLTQFTGNVYGTNTAGCFIVEKVPNSNLIGKDVPRKLAIGFVNWIFHMVSDMAGSSGSIAKGKFGTGLPGPFVSLLKELSSLPFFNNNENTNNFSIWVSKLFNGTLLSERDEYGKIIPDSVIKFDFRAEIGVAHELCKQAIPVVINECIVRGSYFVRYNATKNLDQRLK